MTGSGRITEPTVQDVRHIDDGVEIDMVLPENLFYFQGHFPGRPILPGVVQIDWAVRFADQYLQTDIASAQNFRVKFSSIIEPGHPVTFVLRRSANNQTLGFEMRDHESVLSSGSIRLEAGQ